MILNRAAVSPAIYDSCTRARWSSRRKMAEKWPCEGRAWTGLVFLNFLWSLIRLRRATWSVLLAVGKLFWKDQWSTFQNLKHREKTSGFHDNSQYSDAELSLGPRQAHHLFAPHILNKHSMQSLWSLHRPWRIGAVGANLHAPFLTGGTRG